MRLSARVHAISPSPTNSIDARAKQMQREGIDVVNFGVGEPDFDTPEPIKAAAVEALRQGKTKYTPLTGIPELREAIAAKLRRDNGLEYTPDQIIVSSGGKESLYHAIMAVVDEGDEVLIPAPYWVTYPEQVKLAGGRPVCLATDDESDFKVSPAQLEAAVTPRTRALILNSPSNPTGTVYSREELEALARFCVQHDLYVISDEIYEKLIYEGEHVSIASFGPEIRRRTILVNGVSKAYAMTGWRLGYAAAEPEIIRAMAALQSHCTTHPASVTQYAAVAALKGPEDAIEAMREEFSRRREYILDRLARLPGFRVRRPAGAFYVFPRVDGVYGRVLGGRRIESDLDLAGAFLDEARVAVVPGAGFGAPGYLRFSYATSMERIRAGMDRLEALLQGG